MPCSVARPAVGRYVTVPRPRAARHGRYRHGAVVAAGTAALWLNAHRTTDHAILTARPAARSTGLDAPAS